MINLGKNLTDSNNRLIAATTILAIGFFGYYLPFVLIKISAIRESTKNIILTYGIIFSSGVLLAAGMVHLMGDAAEAFSDKKFPFAYFITGCGFMLIFGVELLV